MGGVMGKKKRDKDIEFSSVDTSELNDKEKLL